jgi:hypothetical protein
LILIENEEFRVYGFDSWRIENIDFPNVSAFGRANEVQTEYSGAIGNERWLFVAPIQFHDGGVNLVLTLSGAACGRGGQCRKTVGVAM